MKIIKKITTVYIIVGTLALTTIGCKKGDDNNTVTAVDSGMVSFHIHSNVNDSEVDSYNTVYTTTDGRKISFSLAQFYVSGIELLKADGSSYPIAGKIVLKTLDEESYPLANVPAGDYTAVRFRVGLDATTNAENSTADSLLNHPEMWLGSTAQPSGYAFLAVQGKIDTTTSATGTTAQMQPFSYKIGTAAHYVQVTLPTHSPVYSISKGGSEFVHLIFDYGNLFNGVQLNNPSNLMVNTQADNSSAISNTIANNIAGAFRYEE